MKMLLVATALLAACAAPGPHTGDATSALTYCQVSVENHLRAPGTAKFQPAPDAMVEKVSENSWSIRSYVDSGNEFGGEVRTGWSCDAVYEDGSYHIRARFE